MLVKNVIALRAALGIILELSYKVCRPAMSPFSIQIAKSNPFGKVAKSKTFVKLFTTFSFCSGRAASGGPKGRFIVFNKSNEFKTDFG